MKPNTQGRGAKSKPTEPVDVAPAAGRPFALALGWRLPLFLIATLIYLFLFYSVEILHTSGQDGVRRIMAQVWMLVQLDFFPEMWLGGDASRFAILDRVPVWLMAALIVVSATLTGWILIRWLRADFGLDCVETLVFSAGVGLNVWSLVTLAIGLCGGLGQTWLFVLLLVGNAALATWMWFQRRALESGVARVQPPASASRPGSDAPRAPDGLASFPAGEVPGWFTRHGGWIGLPFILVILLASTMPPWHFDVREYHLQVPKEWYQQGRVSFLPHNIYGNMPLGAQMHAVLGAVLWPGELDWWYGALVGKTVIAAFAPLTALGLFAAGRRLVSTSGGVVAAVSFISLPWITHVSITGLIEGASAFYLFAAFYGVLLWSRPVAHASPVAHATSVRGSSRATPERGVPLLLLAGFLAGAAVACKYPAVLFVALPLGTWVLLDQWRLNLRSAFVFTLALVAGCGLWFGKNAVLAGNPTYPLFYRAFGGETMTTEKHAQWAAAHAVPRDPEYPADSRFARHSPAQFLEAVRRVLYASDWLSPLLLPLAVAGVLAGRRGRWIWIAIAFLAFYFLAWWLWTHRLDRFWVPMLPLVALATAASVGWLPARSWGWTVALFCCFAQFYNLPLVASRAMGDNRFLVALDDLRTDVPRAADDGFTRIHPAHRWLNRHVPEGKGVLLVGEAQVFDLEVPALYSTCFDECILEKLIRGRSPERRRRALREHGISHVFVHWLEIERYRSPGNYGFTDYITRELLRDELVEQRLLRPVPIDGLHPDAGQIFEVLP